MVMSMVKRDFQTRQFGKLQLPNLDKTVGTKVQIGIFHVKFTLSQHLLVCKQLQGVVGEAMHLSRELNLHLSRALQTCIAFWGQC